MKLFVVTLLVVAFAQCDAGIGDFLTGIAGGGGKGGGDGGGGGIFDTITGIGSDLGSGVETIVNSFGGLDGAIDNLENALVGLDNVDELASSLKEGIQENNLFGPVMPLSMIVGATVAGVFSGDVKVDEIVDVIRALGSVLSEDDNGFWSLLGRALTGLGYSLTFVTIL